MGIIQNKISSTRLTPYFKQLVKPRKPSYFTGLWCLIPVAGAVYGIILAINGISKYRDRWLILIGLGGIAWTILLVWIVSKPLDRAAREAFVPDAQRNLNNLVKSLAFYKYKNGNYPDSLQQLTTDGTTFWIYDPIQNISPFSGNNSPSFNYQRIANSYKIFSSGVDGIPGTADDIYPKVSYADSVKFGLLKK